MHEIQGQLKTESVILPNDFIEEIHNQSFYGRLVKQGIRLTLSEAAYLLHKQKIGIVSGTKKLDFVDFFKLASSNDENFEVKYIVYEDLRGRGYYVQPSVMDFRVYPRGGHPGKTPSKYLLHILSERKITPVRELIECVETANNLKKRIVLAIVDEESDITFYELKKSGLSEVTTTSLPQLEEEATFLGDRTIIWDSKTSKELHQQGFYGKFLDGTHLQLSLVETAYLLKEHVIRLQRANNEPITYSEFITLASTIEPNFSLKYRTYEDLRQRNLIPKTGFKFGAHFRVYVNYNREDKTTHAEYLVHSIPESHKFSLSDFSRASRLAHSVRKHIIYAVISSDSITYLEIMRIKL